MVDEKGGGGEKRSRSKEEVEGEVVDTKPRRGLPIGSTVHTSLSYLSTILVLLVLQSAENNIMDSK